MNCLKCEESAKVKVVSIFGNTGDGKSYTLNECFFNGKEIFTTSNGQDSCTVGVWVAYDPSRNVICLDTEGLLGATSNENQRTRLLLKVCHSPIFLPSRKILLYCLDSFSDFSCFRCYCLSYPLRTPAS